MDISPRSPRHGRGRPSKEAVLFAKYRDVITRLWSVENKTLNEVIETMKVTHHFSATPKQYKKRLNDWKLRKNINTSEMPQLARHKIECDATGTRPILLMNGEEVSRAKVDRFIRRKRDELGRKAFNDLFECRDTTLVKDDQPQQDSRQHHDTETTGSATPTAFIFAEDEFASTLFSDSDLAFEGCSTLVLQAYADQIETESALDGSESLDKLCEVFLGPPVTHMEYQPMECQPMELQPLEYHISLLDTSLSLLDTMRSTPDYQYTTKRTPPDDDDCWSTDGPTYDALEYFERMSEGARWMWLAGPLRQPPTLRSEVVKIRELVQTSKELERFRSRFIYQYERMKRAGWASSCGFQSISNLFTSHRHAWSVAIHTLRGLCRLQPSGQLERIIPFFCLARAISEVLDDDPYLEGFSSDLLSWKDTLETLQDIHTFREGVHLMWDIDLGAVPAGPSLDAHQNLLNLRETAAEFLFKANSVFFSNSSTPAQDQTPDPTELLVDSPSHSSSGNTIPSSPPYATPNKTPPDKQICPSIARLTHVATTNWNIDYSVVQIVTGVIFAIVFLFLQTFHLGGKQAQGITAPSMPSGISMENKHSPSSWIDSAGMNTMLLSRPATPTFEQWSPNFENCAY